jgi:protein-disulfide isomerase
MTGSDPLRDILFPMRYPAKMQRIARALLVVPAVFMLGCTEPTAQSQDPAALRKEIEALKASQAAMQKDIAEIREFLRQVTGGKFGAPSLENATIDLSGAPAKGSASAPITLVEVSDYHCPFCRRHFQQTQPQIYSEFVDSGKVRHVFIHYPIDQLHPEAFRSHEAASCAADQGKFWELHAKLFEAPVRSLDQIVALAPAAGLDSAALRACMDSGKYSSAVRESVKRMQQLGVDSTPMFLIGKTPQNGEPMKVLKVVKGAHPFEQFKVTIEGLL